MDTEEIIAQIREAFGANAYPGDPFLQGSFDGCEPYDEVSAFFGKTDWTALDSKMLDERYCALSFFSEAGFRFFLPAYLIADLRGELLTADPLFHLYHGFSSVTSEIPVESRKFTRISGGNSLLNPRRYGAMTWNDYARHRLAAFTREEARAVIAYMTYKAEHDPASIERPRVEAALQQFWLDRAQNAPSRADLDAHLRKETEFQAALQRKIRNEQ